MSHKTLLIEQFLKRQNTGNHRTAYRFDASAIPAFKSIHQVGGPEVKLINISRRGALIESREPIAPGPSTSLRIVTAEAVYIIKGQVIHYSIHSGNDKEVHYHSAIEFDDDFTIFPADTDEDFTVPPIGPGAA